MYRNERDTGKAITSFLSSSANTLNLKREDIHYTSKLASNGSYEAARKSITQSVKTCGLGYIDLFLLHSPYGGKTARLESWRAVEDAIEDGEVKIGGVSNFGVKHVRRQSPRGRGNPAECHVQIEEMVASKPRIMPAVNQIEVRSSN